MEVQLAANPWPPGKPGRVKQAADSRLALARAKAKWAASNNRVSATVRLAGQPARVRAGLVAGATALAIAAFRGGRLVAQAHLAAVPAGSAEAVLERAVRAELRVWAVLVAEGSGGNKDMTLEIYMTSRNLNSPTRTALAGLLLVVLCCMLTILTFAAAQTETNPARLPQTSPKLFGTPKEAADALIQAATDFNVLALIDILGQNGEDLVVSGDPVRDKNYATAFAAKASEKHEVTMDPKNSTRAILTVGNADWPLPIPIVYKGGKWSFDTKAGREEILRRRIGANELDAIEICRGYVEAQHEYAWEKHDNAEVNQYAQLIISTPGKHNGLAWQNPDGSWGGPVGEPIAKAIQQGYTDRGQPYHGYYFKILKGQGSDAPLGQMDFVVSGAMIGGFALAAAPAEYRVTGVNTFIVSYEGIVYQKDLGPNTPNIVKEMQLYNPDETWDRTDDNW
jgi:hypothetical protein